MKTTSALIISALAFLGSALAFAPPSSSTSSASSISHSVKSTSKISKTQLAPKFDPVAEQWAVTDESELEDGYGPVGSLIRAGPKPFLIRLINQDQYEQAVLKYMAAEKVGRKEAQGNMDAYFENPNDWAYQKNVERNGGYKKDYANANTEPKQLVLTGVWSALVVWFFYDLITGVMGGTYY